LGENGLQVWSKTYETETEIKIHDFQVTDLGFTLSGVDYYVERFGDIEDENLLVNTRSTLIDLNAKEIVAFRSVVEIAKAKGEVLAKVRDKLAATYWKSFCKSLGLPESTARVYLQIATNFDSVELSTTTLGEALKQISKAKKLENVENGEKAEKPRLESWEASLVEVAKSFRVRGSAANLVRLLNKFGIEDEMIKDLIVQS
jgi:hypothetical protein